VLTHADYLERLREGLSRVRKQGVNCEYERVMALKRIEEAS
jgi:hypothetical protein